ncbi:MAG: type II toxin-antitoxin system Phd/YefM family antitoxin [Deltaproteobacteria bacterium]|nr:type II toxin-antitoxin system Phd/YefM family antitoxin [Deltaproteobacteria bacterium]
MRFVSVRDLRNTPATVWAALEEHDLVLTSNGDPVAVVVRIEDDLEQTLAMVRRARAQQAVSQLREAAAQSAAAALSATEIEAEVGAVRQRRKHT